MINSKTVYGFYVLEQSSKIVNSNVFENKLFSNVVSSRSMYLLQCNRLPILDHTEILNEHIELLKTHTHTNTDINILCVMKKYCYIMRYYLRYYYLYVNLIFKSVLTINL